MPTFRDHFSHHAALYAEHRPVYPEELYAWMAAHTPARDRAWDVGTGNGQAARALARWFREVQATDASAEQIAAARPAPGVTYRALPAHASGLESHTVDLVTVAQALHWFDLEPFTAEVTRVVRPGGLVAAWCYELFSITPEVDRPMLRLYHDIVGADWPPERRHIESGYATIAWPWERLDTPAFEMRADWSVDQVVGYLRTWSAVRRFLAREGRDPVLEVEDDLRSAWGSEDSRPVVWPLRVLASRVDPE